MRASCLLVAWAWAEIAESFDQVAHAVIFQCRTEINRRHVAFTERGKIGSGRQTPRASSTPFQPCRKLVFRQKLCGFFPGRSPWSAVLHCPGGAAYCCADRKCRRSSLPEPIGRRVMGAAFRAPVFLDLVTGFPVDRVLRGPNLCRTKVTMGMSRIRQTSKVLEHAWLDTLGSVDDHDGAYPPLSACGRCRRQNLRGPACREMSRLKMQSLYSKVITEVTTEMPRSRSMSIQSERVWMRSFLAFTSPASG